MKDNVVPLLQREQILGRAPTGMEIVVARAMCAGCGESPDADCEDGVKNWVQLLPASQHVIRAMRHLSFDIVQAIRGKPFYDAKDIWETIIDECSPAEKPVPHVKPIPPLVIG